MKKSDVEIIKEKSKFLRGTLVESINNEITGAVAEDDQQLIKFHGTYMQWDRETESERKKQKLEPEYSFMIRVRVPAGISTAKQWLKMNQITDNYGISTLKLTTRQAYELHGVLKRNLKTTMQEINKALHDSIAACGDVVRNVMSGANPDESLIHREVSEIADKISTHFMPHTNAYHEIWLDKKPLVSGKEEIEPVYGKNYLPRKFKISIAVPPVNDTDVFAHDIGLIAIVKNNKLSGFNIAAGGGMGSTFGMPETYPRLATLLGFVPKSDIIDVCEKIVSIQRDFGNRENRKQARLKYTFDRMGEDAFREELDKRLGYSLKKPEPYKFKTSGDQFGWKKGSNDKWNFTLFVEGGRVKDTPEYKLKEGLREIAEIHTGEFILTGNQNLVIANITNKAEVNKLLKKYHIDKSIRKTGARLNTIACVALNLCPLAFSEAERYLPDLMDKIDEILIANKVGNDKINIRMTGCPNGCGRPFLAEIGFIGRAPGKYNMYLGAAHNGERLNTLYKEMLSEEDILKELNSLIPAYAKERNKGESFGDFIHRKEIV